MKINDITEKRNNILSAISQSNLFDAFRLLRSLSQEQLSWVTTDEITRLEDSYRYMLDYAVRGVSDPSRQQVYDGIVSKMLVILDNLQRNAMIRDTPTLYYNKLRYRSHAEPVSIPEYLRRYNALSADASLFNLVAGSAPEATESNRRDREAVERDLFDTLWISFPLSSADFEAVTEAFGSDSLPSYVKQLMLSAIMLGALEFFDSRRIRLLAHTYYNNDPVLSPQALIALLIVLYRYRDRKLDKETVDAIAAVTELPSWRSDLKNAFLELVRARDTERITRKMNDELIPEMMKLRPDLRERLSKLNEEGDPGDLEENPKWQEMLEKSGIADKLKELSEIQLEGGDVFMSTFAHLKGFPFFNDISNWFLPFHADNSQVRDMPDGLGDMAQILESTPVFCNSDKYSFVLSLRNIPAYQRDMVKSQLNSQVEGMIELQKASLTTDHTSRRNVMNRYSQDLYRFFRLFRRKEEFVDPFESDLNLVTIPALKGQFDDNELLYTIAEFYFRHKYYNDALDIFRLIEENSYPDGQLFEKIGFCYERTGDISSALKYYEQAELLDADSLWTLRHIARCYRLMGNSGKALDYYRRVEAKESKPSLVTTMAIGYCMLDGSRWAEAAQQFYKARFNSPDSPKPLRPLAWSLMMQRDFDRAKSLYDEILTANPTADDYLNMGHLSLAIHDAVNALNYYKISITSADGTFDSFARKLRDDAEALSCIGVDPAIIPLILDSIKYSK